MKRKPYPSDLTDEQWQLIEPLMPRAKRTGRPPADLREVVNGILYILRSGCAWRMLPHDFGPWHTVWTRFWLWRIDGTWERIMDALRVKLRKSQGRKGSPSAAIIDTQSVKTTEGGPRGFDAAKNITGRKRHIVVDTEGLLLDAMVLPGDIQDRDGARPLLGQLKAEFPRLQKIWADAIYGGQLVGWVKDNFGWVLEIVRRPSNHKSFVLLPRRWVVERTFSWLGRYRRLSKDYEKLPETSETMIHIAMVNLMLHRLAPG